MTKIVIVRAKGMFEDFDPFRSALLKAGYEVVTEYLENFVDHLEDCDAVLVYAFGSRYADVIDQMVGDGVDFPTVFWRFTPFVDKTPQKIRFVSLPNLISSKILLKALEDEEIRP